jgi:DNA mismatch repair ATPase MutS
MGFEARMALIAVGAVEGLFSVPLRNRVLGIIHGLHEPSHDLDLLAELLAVVEAAKFESPRLAELHGTLRTHGEPASKRIAQLRRLQELLDSRDNVFVRMFGPLLLWGTQTAMAVENWRAENGPDIARWLDAVAEMEALSALANYAWEHPGDPFPELAEEAVFEGEEMCHPLLPSAKAVANSVTLAGPVRLYVVSGSNMSGKSTLLRTTGVNAVLALAGAPVRARRVRISRLNLGASIRTQDSLEEGHSRFMAEILRLKQVLDLPAPAFFLLDELLHGTNSHDRSIGAEGLVRALLNRGALGLTTTHDLSLAKVADQLAPAARNVHFEDRLENGRLIFDYRMREGVVQRSNALDLMRAAGLDV